MGYFWVTLGPIPGMPAWHQQSQSNTYPFPTREAAERFAANPHHARPGRAITIQQDMGDK